MDSNICCKCGKDMSPIGDSPTVRGTYVTVRLEDKTPDNIAYSNKQLGRYSDGEGGCDVAICYECYIDVLFQMPHNTNKVETDI